MRLIILSFLLLFLNNLYAISINFKSGKKASSYYEITSDLQKEIKALTNNSLNIKKLDSSGSIENIQTLKKIPSNYVFTSPVALLEQIKNDITKVNDFDKKSYKSLRSLFIFPSASMHFIIRKDSQIDIFEDMENKKIFIAKDSFGGTEAKEYIRQFGLKGKINFIEDELSKAVSLLANKKIDGFVSLSPYPSLSVLNAQKQIPITLLTLDSERVYQVGRKEDIIPANTYEGITKNIITTNLAIGVFTTSELSEINAYRLTRAFWKARANLESKNTYWKNIKYENLSQLNIKLHKGALRYYDEIGVYVPRNLR